MASMCRWSVPQQPPTTDRFGKLRPEGEIVGRELVRIALIELFGFVQFGVAHLRRIRAEPADPLLPRRVVLDHVREVSGCAQLIMK